MRMREFLPVIRATRKLNKSKDAWCALLRCFSSDLIFITGSVCHVSSRVFLMQFSSGWFPCIRTSAGTACMQGMDCPA